MNLEKQVLKVLPDFFFNYYLDLDIRKEEKIWKERNGNYENN